MQIADRKPKRANRKKVLFHPYLDSDCDSLENNNIDFNQIIFQY